MNSSKLFITAIIFLLFISPINVAAQEGENQPASYIVQTGDTLYSIALQFGTTVDEIIQINNIINPNAISVGDILVIPGLTWLSGIIQSQEVKLGDNFRNLSRLYDISANSFARLNYISSPDQLYVGSWSVITHQESGLNNAGKEIVEPSGLLAIGAGSNTNPWQLALDNKLEGTWQAVEGDVIFDIERLSTPHSPAAFPSDVVSLTLKTPGLYQGETAVFHSILESGTMKLNAFGYNSNFHSLGYGQYAALQGIHAKMEPGRHEVVVEYISDNGTQISNSQYVEVYDGGFIYEALTVPNDYLADEVSDIENQRISSIVSGISDDKKWDGVLFPPSPFPNSISSTFGNRRSYNGSAYDYYHTGVDFGGGLGVQIFAVAPGTVVMAEETTVRGNAVIIDHGWGIYSGYWHQSEILVSVGDQVEVGQVIGLVGNTGRSNGAHLHWELWVNQVPVNPLSWLYNEYP